MLIKTSHVQNTEGNLITSLPPASQSADQIIPHSPAEYSTEHVTVGWVNQTHPPLNRMGGSSYTKPES